MNAIGIKRFLRQSSASHSANKIGRFRIGAKGRKIIAPAQLNNRWENATVAPAITLGSTSPSGNKSAALAAAKAANKPVTVVPILAPMVKGNIC